MNLIRILKTMRTMKVFLKSYPEEWKENKEKALRNSKYSILTSNKKVK